METEKQEMSREELYHKETHCPSCGRFVGPLTRCPYCQALTQKRLSIRVFKLISVLLSTVGLFCLLFYARNVKTPEVKINQLGALSNFAHVAIEGVVADCRGLSKWGSLTFSIHQPGPDGTMDTIKVAAYNKVAKEINGLNLVPNNGDIVRVEGQVRAQKDDVSLLINAAQHISFVKRTENVEKNTNVIPKIIPNVELEAINKEMLNQYITVTGSVLRVVYTDYGTNIVLDNGSEVGFSVWVPKYAALSKTFKQGDLVKATGIVSEYNDTLQVKVDKKGTVDLIKSVSAQ